MRLTYEARPSALLTVEAADRHHELIHTPAARAHLIAGGLVRRYGVDRVEATLGIDGTLRQAPGAWRFIQLDFGEDWRPEDGVGIDARLGQEVVRDHVNFLRELRTFHVTPEVVADRRTGQCTTAKLVVVSEHVGDIPRELTTRRHADLVEALGAVIVAGFGRLLVSGPVLREIGTIDLREPGQLPGGPPLAESSRVAVDELYCDNTLQAEQLLAQPDVTAALRAFAPHQVAVHLVREWVGLDRS